MTNQINKYKHDVAAEPIYKTFKNIARDWE